MDITTKKFLKPKEVQELLSISYPTLMRWTKDKSIPYIKIGGQLRFPKDFFIDLYNESLEGFSA